jgi:PTS system nitrogen regulatory IIA component
MDVREVQRLADRGKLPGHKVGGQWRFNRQKVTEWLQQEMHKLDEARLIALESSMGGGRPEVVDETGMIVTDLIGLDGIDLALPARTRASVLRELVRLAEQTGLLYDADGLLEAVQQREDLCSTALPNGVAIPHPRQPMPYVSAEPLICVALVPGGIGFGASSSELTRVFILICCHDDHYHLCVLARLMRMLAGDTVDRLLGSASREELLAELITRETEVLKRSRK